MGSIAKTSAKTKADTNAEYGDEKAATTKVMMMIDPHFSPRVGRIDTEHG